MQWSWIEDKGDVWQRRTVSQETSAIDDLNSVTNSSKFNTVPNFALSVKMYVR